MGISGNLAPIINIYSNMGGSQRKRRSKWHPRKESLSRSSSDSRSSGSQVRQAVQAYSVIRSLPPIHESVHLQVYINWYMERYTKAEDWVSGDVWDQLQAKNMSISTIKGLTLADWALMSIPMGTGAKITKRATLFESKVTNGN